MTTPRVTVSPKTPARELNARAPKEDTVETRERVSASIVTAGRA